MPNLFMQPMKGPGGAPSMLWGSFAPNGTSDPLTASNGGSPGVRAFTTVYAATGNYTVTLPADCNLPANTRVFVSAQAADLTGYFEAITLGNYDASTRSFVVQAKRANSGEAVAAAAGARIVFILLFNDDGV